MIILHCIYNIYHNICYLYIGTSHDTSEFVCDNIELVWNSHLESLKPDARILVILYDSGGSNSCLHRIVKQNFMCFADRIRRRILVMHYPPYHSKFNPIEHRFCSLITSSWIGVPLYTEADTCRGAASTAMEVELKVFAEIVDKVSETGKKVLDSFPYRLDKQIVFDYTLLKWNYIILPLYRLMLFINHYCIDWLFLKLYLVGN